MLICDSLHIEGTANGQTPCIYNYISFSASSLGNVVLTDGYFLALFNGRNTYFLILIFFNLYLFGTVNWY